eukprot:CAMPEP_0113262564 /NCGR_PEP_ID=MMETSP0008_2-20120614/17992_1 /TAXON_ID=97485 /ORGANISM="Prymnesium parvum" /LENGTH=139 /DNA_ID=CAMNT_0000111237 /DNA_START=219 /DNA_END=638 /DNA_ORIENTATION=+ /assembly_acc=CAM_ASM_000153
MSSLYLTMRCTTAPACRANAPAIVSTAFEVSLSPASPKLAAAPLKLRALCMMVAQFNTASTLTGLWRYSSSRVSNMARTNPSSLPHLLDIRCNESAHSLGQSACPSNSRVSKDASISLTATSWTLDPAPTMIRGMDSMC